MIGKASRMIDSNDITFMIWLLQSIVQNFKSVIFSIIVVFHSAIFETQKRDFQGDWTVCDADLGWRDNVYEFMYDYFGSDWRDQYSDQYGDEALEDSDYLAKKKPGYFTFEDMEPVMSFYCECYEPLRWGFKWIFIRWTPFDGPSEINSSLKPYDKVSIHSCLEIKGRTTTSSTLEKSSRYRQFTSLPCYCYFTVNCVTCILTIIKTYPHIHRL